MAQDLVLSSLLTAPATKLDGRPAVLVGDEATSYEELDLYARRVASWLLQQGIGKGDRVAVWLVNNVEWLGLLFGAARVGATLVSVNTRYRAYEVEYLLKKSGACMLIMQPGFRKIAFADLIRDVDATSLPKLEKVAVVGEFSAGGETILDRTVVPFVPDDLEPVSASDESDPENPLILFTTSGTTSGPKLVVHTSRSIVLHSRNVARNEGMDAEGARVMAALPLCGVFGLNAVLGGFAGGAMILLMDAFDPALFARTVREKAATHAYGSDEMYDRILEELGEDDTFPTARRFGYASFHPGIEAFMQRMKARSLPTVGLYGSSEVQALFSLQKLDAPDEERRVGGGYPVSGDAVRVRVCDPDTGLTLPVGEIGEIQIAGPTNFSGYLDDEVATAKAITADGFFRTGDIGFLRADGSFVYEGRGGDALRIGGFLVSPAEIESAVKALGGVDNVQVVGVRNADRQSVVAFVVPVAGAQTSEDALRAEMRGKVAAFKVPDIFWIVSEFPVTQSANGTKIQRAKLREMALERLSNDAVQEGKRA